MSEHLFVVKPRNEHLFHERMFAFGCLTPYPEAVDGGRNAASPAQGGPVGDDTEWQAAPDTRFLLPNRSEKRGYPPSVREIGEAVGLTSSSTVHAHLQVLQREGFLMRDPTKPRAIVVQFEPSSGAALRVRPASPTCRVSAMWQLAAGCWPNRPWKTFFRFRKISPVPASCLC